MSRALLILSNVLMGLLLVPVAHGFFNQLDELKAELATLQTAHAADFGDLMNTLDDISGPSFSDVSATKDWFGKYVASVSDWGIVSGYRDAQGNLIGKFGPGNNVTVAELLKMSFKAAQVDEAQCSLVPPTLSQAIGHWAASYVSCGEQKNVRILKDPNVDLNRPAKRAEVVSVLDDVFGEKVPPLFSNFKDTQGHPLESDIAYAYTRGIVSGDEKNGVELGTFRPDAAINRAEVAKIVYQWLKQKVKQEVAQS